MIFAKCFCVGIDAKVEHWYAFRRGNDEWHEAFLGLSFRSSSLDISNVARFPRRIPRANLSETSPKSEEHRYIYRMDLKYKLERIRVSGHAPIF